MEYILITPIKNEIKALSKLKESVFNQTQQPILWVIVDSNSSDGSYELASKLFCDYPWIHIINQKQFVEQGYSHANFSCAINEGYIHAKNICDNLALKYSYVGKTDATPILSPDYFETLAEVLDKDPSLAFVCGLQKLSLNNKVVDIKSRTRISIKGINDIRLYRKEFFESVDGYPLFYSPDTILMIKALNRGLNVRLVDKTYFIKPRIGGTKIGSWNGYKLKGKSMYALCYHPLLLMLNAFYFTAKFPPHYQAIPLIMGYISSIGRVKRIDDPEVSEYFWNKKLKEILFSISKL